MSPLVWLDRVDPGTHRRIKGLRLVTAFGLAWLMAHAHELALALPGRASLGTMAAGFALWASVSEGSTTRWRSSRDLCLLVLAAAGGAVSMLVLAPWLAVAGPAGSELTLVSGAFLVGYLRRFRVLGAGIGSQVFIGQLLAYGAGWTISDLPTVGLAGLIAMVAAIVPRVLSGPAELPATLSIPQATERPAALSAEAPTSMPPGRRPELRMGLQAASAALAIVLLDDTMGLEEAAWAITACTYVIAGTTAATLNRVWRRIAGTAVGVPLGLLCLPVAEHWPLVVWLASAVALIVYAMALPERYDIACGAYAFALVVTLAAAGDGSPAMLAARAWETVVGGALGLVTALVLFPIRPPRPG